MPSAPSLLDQCFDRVLRETPALLGCSLNATVAALQDAENQSREVAQRTLLARAWWGLERQRNQLTAQYPLRLQQAFQRGDHDGPTSSMGRMSDSSLLALVDDSSVNESLEAARMLQALLPVVEQALSMVDARMSSLIGLDTVHAEKNPLRPSVFVRTLRDLMAEHEPDPQVRGLWMQKVVAPLAKELSQLYGQVALMLQQARVPDLWGWWRGPNCRCAGSSCRTSPERAPAMRVVRHCPSRAQESHQRGPAPSRSTTRPSRWPACRCCATPPPPAMSPTS